MLTYHGRFQACGVREGGKGGICIIQTGFAFCLEFLEEVEKPESEHGTRPFPCCREPTDMHELNATESRGGNFATETVGNTDGVDTRDIEEGELSWG